MKRALTIVLALVFAICFTACEKAPFLTMTGPRSYTFTREGGTQTFAFSCNRDWSVSSSESWIRISPSSGTASDGDISVTITCSPNTTYDSRTATITVKVEELVETISVSQETGIGLIVSPTSYDLTNTEQSIEVEVQQNVNYSIEIDDACKDWIKKGGTKALSTDKVTFNISANTSYDNREGKITFKQTDGNLVQTVTVKQVARVALTAVDLGLSVKWANMNVGATSPEDFGDFFAWGEVESKTTYTWENYKWANGAKDKITKYSKGGPEYWDGTGNPDMNDTLEPEDDAAHVILGGKWRTPRDRDISELIRECTVEHASVNGIDGLKVTGPNGNSIFLPAAGYYEETYYGGNFGGAYWCSQLGSILPYLAMHMFFQMNNDASLIYATTYRCDGLSIRPVTE